MRFLSIFWALILRPIVTFTRNNELQANYDLRSRCTELDLPNPKREFLKNSFGYSGAKLWNSLPTEAKLAISENVFKLNLN